MEIKAKELLLYSEKVSKEEFRNMFGHLTKRSVSLLGILDFSYLWSKLPSPIIVQRTKNTIRFFAEEKKSLMQMSHLLFPFRVGESVTITSEKGSFLPFPRLYVMGSENMLNFLIKEDVVEFTFNIRRIFGKFLGFATSIDASGRKAWVLLTKPEVFFEIDLEKNPAIYIELLEPIPKSISMTSTDPVFEDANTKIGMDSYDPIQHSLILGESGSGKTKALLMMIKALEKRYGDSIRIIVLDPHGEFIQALPDYKVIDFKQNYIEPLDIGGEKSPLMTQLIAQLISSAIGEENKYAERVLFYSTYLLSSIDALSLKNMSSMLTDPATRMEFSTKSDVDEARRFFDQEYQDIYIHHFNNAVLPILNFVGEYELYLGKEMDREMLHDVVEKNPVTIVSFDPNFFGKRMIKFLAGAIINQMYILAITNKVRRPTILIVDEFPRVETLVVKDILAETRKFNLYLLLSMQYMGQLRKEILDGIISNTRNIISFKTNRVDASLVSSIMEIKLEEYFKKNRTTTELEESKKEMFVRLNQRECIVRLFDGKRYLLPMKLRAVDIANWGLTDIKLSSRKDTRPSEHKIDQEPPSSGSGGQQEAASAQQKPKSDPFGFSQSEGLLIKEDGPAEGGTAEEEELPPAGKREEYLEEGEQPKKGGKKRRAKYLGEEIPAEEEQHPEEETIPDEQPEHLEEEAPSEPPDEGQSEMSEHESRATAVLKQLKKKMEERKAQSSGKHKPSKKPKKKK